MISEGVEQTVQWFRQSIELQQRRIVRLEGSLAFYKALFWGVAILLAAFIAGAILEVW